MLSRTTISRLASALLLLFSLSVVAAAQRIPDQVSSKGVLRISVLGHEPDAKDLKTLVSASDLVIRGRILTARSRLNRTQESILTDFSFRVEAVLRNKSSASSVPSIVRFTLLGGRVELPGGIAEFEDGNFALPKVGDEYVLFLRRQGDNPQSYEIGEQPDPDKYVEIGRAHV